MSQILPHLIYHIELMEQPFDDVHDIYNQKLGEVLDFFASKLQIYYSSSRLTLLLTLFHIPPDHLHLITGFRADVIPLPSRLKMVDHDAFGLHRSFSYALQGKCYIFRDFLDSGHALALDGQRHATAASACLKIIFMHDHAPHSRRTLRVAQSSQRHRADLKREALWHRSVKHWNFRSYLSSQKLQKFSPAFVEFVKKVQHQHLLSGHLKSLLEKSAHSRNLLNFARRRVFRFGYLQRNHPTYMKKAIFSLAKYIHRVTGETVEVRACASIWERDRWFTAS